MLDKEYILNLFYYLDGSLYWKNPTAKCMNRNDFAGKKRKDGYIDIKINGKIYLAHRLIFLYHHGYLPKYIDHIDGNPLNNKIENLREATQQQNCKNSKISKANTSGVKNVSFSKKSKKWQVSLSIDKKLKHIGFYEDLELAEFVAIEARNKYYKEFARHS
jgi:hypothetical protein